MLRCPIARPRRALQLVASLPARLRSASLPARIGAGYRYDRGQVVAPSELAKRRHLLRIFSERGHRVFVESGTYRGGTVDFLLGHAERLISVEIEPSLYESACMRFAHEPTVELHHGDAAALIPPIVSQLDEPPLLWLDGHFTGGVNEQPFGEIEPAPTILGALRAVDPPAGLTVLVDDLRLFGRGGGFPTLDVLVGAAKEAFPKAQIFAGLDSLVIYA